MTLGPCNSGSVMSGMTTRCSGDIKTMDELKFNKIFAGVLLAGLLLMAGIKAGDILVPSHDSHGHGGGEHKNSYPIEVADLGDAGAVVAAPAGPEPILALLAEADIAAGMKLAKICTACHVFEEGGANKVGPVLWNIVNADKGAIDGFGYSTALAAFGGGWDYASLNAFLYKPKAYIEGTKMNFAGLKKPKDRANMIAYLRSLSGAPAALPTDAEIASEAQ